VSSFSYCTTNPRRNYRLTPSSRAVTFRLVVSKPHGHLHLSAPQSCRKFPLTAPNRTTIITICLLETSRSAIIVTSLRVYTGTLFFSFRRTETAHSLSFRHIKSLRHFRFVAPDHIIIFGSPRRIASSLSSPHQVSQHLSAHLLESCRHFPLRRVKIAPSFAFTVPNRDVTFLLPHRVAPLPPPSPPPLFVSLHQAASQLSSRHLASIRHVSSHLHQTAPEFASHPLLNKVATCVSPHQSANINLCFISPNRSVTGLSSYEISPPLSSPRTKPCHKSRFLFSSRAATCVPPHQLSFRLLKTAHLHQVSSQLCPLVPPRLPATFPSQHTKARICVSPRQIAPPFFFSSRLIAPIRATIIWHILLKSCLPSSS
jgi:hypothetical protein